jgi:hypothetical protein
MPVIIGWIVAVLSFIVFLLALQRIRVGKFLAETPVLYIFGSYVWGDALILSWFWLGVGLAYALGLFTVKTIFTIVLLFHFFRSAYEVVYWLNHQATGSKFAPPLIRNTMLTPEQGAILYQLTHFLVVVISAAVLWSVTFGG